MFGHKYRVAKSSKKKRLVRTDDNGMVLVMC